MSELRDAIIAEAKNLGVSANDLATVISYETAGTLDPWQKGPTTKWGQHRGLIHATQYLKDAGVRPGHGLMDIYSAINAGGVGRYNASDEKAGGAPGTVRDKVLYQMAGHKAKGRKLLGGLIDAPASRGYVAGAGDETQAARPDNGEAAAQAAETRAAQALLDSYTDTNPYTDVQAPDTYDRYEQAELPQDEPYSFFEAVAASASTDWMVSNIVSQLGSEYEEDPDFEISPEEWATVSAEYPEIYHDKLLGARSAGDFAERQAWVEEDVRVNNKLDDMGWQGTVIRGGMMIMDPAALASIVASEGIVAPIVAAAKFGRLGRILMRGTALSTEAATFEAINAEVNPKITTADIVAAGGLGMLLGGTLGAIQRPATAAEAKAMRNVAQSIMEDPDLHFNTKGAGAAETGRVSLGDFTEIVDVDSITDVGKRGWRVDMSAWMNKSKDSITKLWGRALLDEGVGMADHSVSKTSASIRGSRRHKRTETEWASTYAPAMDEWAKSQGKKKGLLGVGDYSDEDWYEFGGQVGDYVRDRADDAASTHNPHAVRAGNAFRKVMKEFSEDMANPAAHRGGIADPLSEVGYDPYYFPRYADGDSIAAIAKKYDDGQVINFLKQAIKNVQLDIDDELLHKIAKGYWDNIRLGAVGARSNIDDALHRGSLSDFKASIIEANGGKSVDDAVLENLFYEAEEALAEGATKRVGRSDSPRTKRKTFLDENFETTLVDKNRVLGERPLRMSDFFARDADFALRKYSRHMSGRLALADTVIRDPNTGKVLQHGVYSDTEIKAIIDQSEKSWTSKLGELSKDEVAKGIHASRRDLGYAFSGILGHPLYDTQSLFNRNMRRMMGLNFYQLMMSMGLNQVQETARWIGGLGLKAALSQMPTLKRVIDPVTGASVSSNKFLRELQAITGKGLDVDFRRWSGRFDDDLLATAEYGGRGRMIDKALIKMGQFTSQVSMMNRIHAWQQNGAMKGISQRLYDLSRHTLIKGADGTKVTHFDLSKLKGKELQKLRSLGWDDKDIKQMFRHFQHAEVDGTHLKALNFEKWDPDAKSMFGDNLYRYTNRLIQENDMGDLNHWMTQPSAKMIFQFRSFIMAAFVKNTLHGIHHFDSRVFVQTMGELVAGVSTFATLTHIRALGRSDREEYLEERLSWDNLVLQGFARMAAASIIPAAIDAVPGVSLFKDARASGSPTDAVFGSFIFNQTVGALSKGMQGGVEALVMGRSMTQGEVRALWRGLMNNHLALAPILNAMISDLPEKKPR
jgi:hypothetical protein